MADVIIDTNVAMIANRQNDDVVESCVSACIQFLIDARTDHVVLMDDGGAIRAEYAAALQMRRPYELGAQFLIHILRNQYDVKYVRLVHLARTDAGGFEDFPHAEVPDFDLSDRKFAALSRVTGVSVTNAVDSDWAIHQAELEANGVSINFLCGEDRSYWFLRDNC